MLDLGYVLPGTTINVPFATYDSNDPSASVTTTGLAATDIEVYKDGNLTQRASDTGYAVDIDFDALTGLHTIQIDLSSNATAGFFAAGSEYLVAVSSITVDAATVSLWAARFVIGIPGMIHGSNIAVYTSTDNFTLTAGSADNDAYNGCIMIAYDAATQYQTQIGVIEDYTGATRTVNLLADPGVFTMAANDNIIIMPPALLPTVAGRTLDVTATGAAGIDWGNVENPTTALDLSGTDIQLCDTTTAVTNGVTLANGAVTNASLAGNMEIVFETDFATNYNTTRNAWATNAQDFVGTSAADPFNGQVVAASVTGAVGSVTGAVGSVTGNVGGNVVGSVGSNLELGPTEVNAQCDTALSDIGLQYLVNTALPTNWATDITANSALDQLADDGTAVYDRTTDSLQAIADSGGGGPTAAQIADAVWDEAQADHVAAGSFGVTATEIADILVDTNELQGDWVNGGRLDLILDSRMAEASINTTGGAVNNVTLVATTTTNTDMRGTDSAALASVCTEGRLAELDAANLPTTTDNILTDTADIQANYATAANLATVDTNVDNLNLGIIYGTAQTGTLSQTQATTDLTGYLDDELIGAVIVFTGGTANGQRSDITDYAAASGLVTFTAITTAPANGDTFKIV
jgi:hypothetical protein